MKVRHDGLCGVNHAVRRTARINHCLMLMIVRNCCLNRLDRDVEIFRHARNVS